MFSTSAGSEAYLPEIWVFHTIHTQTGSTGNIVIFSKYTFACMYFCWFNNYYFHSFGNNCSSLEKINGWTVLSESFHLFPVLYRVSFAAMLVIILFSLTWKMLPTSASGNSTGIWLPIITLVITMSGRYVRQVRAAVINELNKEYIQMERARGIKEYMILFAGALKKFITFNTDYSRFEFWSAAGWNSHYRACDIISGNRSSGCTVYYKQRLSSYAGIYSGYGRHICTC